MILRRSSFLKLAVVSALVVAGQPASAAPARSLTELQVALYGIVAGVDPLHPIVPKQTASGLRIVVTAGGKTLSASEVARLLGGPFEVQADLSGPGLQGTIALPRTGADAIPSPDPLVLTFPGLPHAGEYDIANIRLVRSGRPVLDVLPRRVTLRVIEQILVTSVVTRPLTLDEIRERGVVLDASAYLGFEFAITLKLESTPVQFRFPVVFDRQGVPIPIPLEPPPEPLRSVLSAPQLVPVLLRPAAFEADPDGAPPDYNLADLPGFGGVKIPSLLVIPGSVGYLKQFFSAQLIVGNGAPAGSGLVVKEVSGTLRLPTGADGVTGTADDPLALPDLESGPQSGVVAVIGDGGTSELLPGEFGRAELTLRGEREGRHDVDFDIRAELLGLPIGPVPLEGSARGVVLVRNAYFDVTFTVPTVVRADEEFSVYATVTNVGQGAGNDVKMTLDSSRLSGARLLSAGTQTIASLPPGDAATLEYRFRSEVTGEVVASYLRFDTSGGVEVTGRLNFVLGVGERRVAQSPDTLVLPAALRSLPSDVVRAAMRVLGQAWSAATATSLPPGVERPSTEAVFRKGLSVAEAGLRVELGQPMAETLRDLLLDLHGDGLDPGFDQVLRETKAGRDLDRILGAALAAAAASDPLGYEEAAARIAASGPAFVSVALENQGGGAIPAELFLRDGAGRVTSEAARAVPGAVIASFGSLAPAAAQLGWIAALDAPPYAIEIAGAAGGVVGLSLTLPDAAGGALHARLDGIPVLAGSRHRLVYDPARAGELILETDEAGDGVFEARQPLAPQPLASEGPRLVAAATIGPETLDGASPYGTYAALLFDRVVSEADAALVSNYEIEHNSVLAAKRQLSGRLVFVAFEQPEGPLVPTEIAATGLRDERGTGGARQEQPLGSRLLLPAAVVSGRVLEAGGQPVPDTLVTYLNTSSGHDGGRWDCRVTSESGVAAQRTDAAGRFTFRYVPQNPCGGPFRLETLDPTTGALRGTKSYVRVNGQRLSLDLVLIGHGRVAGTVSHAAGGPAAGARVRVVSVTDSQVGVVTTTDDLGHYKVEGMTVGAVTVTAVHGANLGRGAGRLDVAGGTATVNVTLDGNVDITGVVRKLEGGVLTPVPGVDVVYYVGGTPLGLSVTDAQGQYRLLGVPAGPYRLDAGLNQRDKTSLSGNSVAGQKLVQNLVIEVLDYSSYGTVKGTVKRLDGSPMPDAWVSDNVVSTRADSLGAYELAGVALGATPRAIQAVSPDGRRSGQASVVLSVPGQVVTGIDIQLSGLGAAAFQVLDSGGAPVAGASVGLQGSCLHPCGCRFSTTDLQGIARFADLSFGPVSARAVVQGAPGAWDTALGSAVVSSEQVAAGGVIRLDGFGSVTGLVANPGGQPAHGATVELTGRRAVIGGGVCDLQSVALGTAYTDTAGQFRFEGVHVGPVSVHASSVAFPRTVAAGGTIGAAGGTEHLELQLVDTLAGVLSGTVWLPDGTAGAGPDVEVTANGPVPDVTVRTDAQGRYAFAQVLPAGGYLLTARDTRPGGTGSVVQTRVWLQASQPAQHDLRLKAKGPVRVTVVDGSGQPVDGAVVHVSLAESDFPYRRYEGTIAGLADQPLEFPAVFEGDFSVSVSDNFARGGRASGAVPPQGLPVDVTVQLTTTGSVSGRFLWADHVTPLPLGTVRLWAGGRLIGQQTTASEGDAGSFAFDFVPAGPVSLTAEDPKSGRTGVASGNLTAQGQQQQLDVVAYAVGRVEGDVTLNEAPAPAAEVSLRSGQYSVRVTTDGAGRYAVDGVPAGVVYASADLGAGFLAGSAQGQIELEGETLQLPIALRGAGTIDGTLLAADGTNPGAVSLVTLNAWGHRQTTTTDDQGRFHFDLVPEGALSLLADTLSSIDCARESLNVTGGSAVPVTLRLRGVGAVEGTAQGSSGPVAGTLSVIGTSAGCESRQWILSVGPSGQFRIPELVGGPVSASFSTRAPGGPWLYASDADVVAPGATTTLSLQVEPSGSVRGSVAHGDGSPAIGSQVRIDASAGRTAVVQTGGDGSFLAEGLPAGAITIRVNDPARGGVALVTGLGVTAGGILEAGEIGLLETPLAVVSVAPPDGATNVPVLQPIQVTFNAPLAPYGGLSVRAGGRTLGFGASLSTDARTVTLTPAGAWPDSTEVTVESGPWVTDVYGRRLTAPHQARLRTVDLSPPRVIGVTPADRAIQVALGTSVAVRFDEPLDTTLDLSPLVQLASGLGPVAGAVTWATSDTLLFTPLAALASNTTYTVMVNGARDLLGHVQTSSFTSSFMTPDADPPVLRLDSPQASGYTKQKRPTIRVVIEDALSGPDGSRASLRLDSFLVTPVRSASQLSHVPPYDLVDGPHAVEATAHDRAENPGTLFATFYVDSQAPTGALVTSPPADQIVSGVVTLAGTATDTGSGVAHLDFLRDGQWVAEGPAANGFQAGWDTAASPDGAYLVRAQPVDVAGNSGLASPGVRVIVNNQPLTVAFTSPAPGFPVKSQVAVAASPSEPVARVEFRAGSGPVVVDETAPFEAVLDVSAEAEGELELVATAIGLAPETASASRSVLVDRTPPTAPANVHAESFGDASVLVAGPAASVELGARVEVENPARSASKERPAFADGSFALRIAGDAGDEVRVVAIDVAGNRSEPLVLEVVSSEPAADAVPRDGLALWARSGHGVVVDAAGRASRWTDASAAANDLVQSAPGQRPSRVTDPVSGRSLLRFDGADDVLQFSRRLAGTIRTVFAVVREDAGAGSVSRALLGDATTADFYGGWPNWWSWMPPYVSTSASVVNGQTWVNGAVVNGRTTPRPTTLSVLCVETTAGVTASRLGAGFVSSGWKGEVAELLVYERPLSIAERKAVEDYLALEYVSYVATAGAPRFEPNGGTFEDSIDVALSSPTPGAHVRYTTDGMVPTESSPLYDGPFTLTTSATVRARAFRPAMKPSPVSAVSFERASDFSPGKVAGIALWVRGDVGVEADAAGRLGAWRDRSGRANDLVQPTPSLQPVVVPGLANALPAVHFDGADDLLGFTTRLDASIRTLFAVVWEDADAGAVSRSLLGDATTADFYGGWPNWWVFMPPFVSTSQFIVNGQTWVNGAVVDGRTTPRPAMPSVVCVEATAGVTASQLGKGFVGGGWKGHVAELVLYDRALTAFERKSVEDYLAFKYAAYAAVAGAPVFTPNGGAFDGSVDVALSTPTTGGQIRYTTDGSAPTAASPLYAGPFVLAATTTVRARTFHSAMSASPVTLATFTNRADFSPGTVSGLALWVRGDIGVETDAANRISAWRDQSGRGNDLVQATPALQPVVAPDLANGLPAAHFDGSDDALSFTTALVGTIRTVFAVVWEDDDAGGDVSRALLGDATTADFYGGWPYWWSWMPPYVSTSEHIVNGQTWVNGTVVNGRTTPRPRTMSVVCVEATAGVTASRVGKGFVGNGWKGHVAELVVYDRALTAFERKSVEDYLALRYAAYQATAGAPVFTPNGGAFDDTVSVALTTPTAGAEIRYTTDGSEPLESSPSYATPLVLTATTTIRARTFRPDMIASPVTLATFTNRADFSPRNVPGIALWVRGDIGVEKDALNRVAAWRDQSDRANDLVQSTPSLQPLVVPGVANQLPALRFDGSDDLLGFTQRLDASIRTVFAVVSEDQDAGAVSRALLGDPSTYDFYGGWPNWWVWMPPYVSTSTFIVNGQTWVNGASINGRTTPRPTTLSVLCVEATAGVTASQLGKGAISNGWKGHVAELVVFDRALTAFERKSVEDYLALRYAAYVPTVGAPVFTPNGGAFETSVSVTLASPSAGARIHYTTDGSEPTEASPRFEAPLVVAATTTLRARAFRAGMSPSPVSTATFSLASEPSPRSVPGLALWVRGDAGVEIDSSSRVIAWRDQSGRANDLIQTSPELQPLVAPGAANALPAVRFDGTDDVLSFTKRLDGSLRTLFAVVWEDQDAGAVSRALLGDATTYDFYGGWPNWWFWMPPYVSTSQLIVNGQTWLNGVVVNGTTTARPTAMSVLCVEATAGVTASLLGDGGISNGWKGHVAELAVYDRALSAVERKAVEDYLALKYQAYVATAGAPAFTPNGGAFETSTSVAVATGTPGGTIRYTTDGSEPSESSPIYTEPLLLTSSTVVRARAYHPAMNPSPVAAAAYVKTSPGSPGTLSGLALWVASDVGVLADDTSRVQTWLDLSGRANHLQAAGAAAKPLLVPPAGGALPRVRFDGVDDVLKFANRITTVRTVFWVLREDPSATPGYRFLLGDVDSYNFHSGANHEIWSSTWAEPAVQMGETRINGSLVDGTTTPRPTSLSLVSLVATGPLKADAFTRDRTNARAWWGDVAELVVYDRALTATERKAVEDHLALKHGLYVPIVSAPVFTPAGSTTLDPVSVTIASEPGAEIRYTTDETTPTQSSTLYSAPLSLTARTVLRARAFKPGFQPSSIAEGRFLDSAPPAPKIPAGLALWVRSDAGVSASGGTVSAWADQSGNGNHLVQPTPALRPLYLPDAQNGLPVLRFDGSNDTLGFTTRLDSTIRTVFAVLKQNGAQSWRVLLGDVTKDDWYPGSLSFWSQASPAILNGETWLNGVPVDGTTTSRPQSMAVLSVLTTTGVTADRLFDGPRGHDLPWVGDIAELIVYTQPLTGAQRKLIEDYLTLKYAPFVGTVGAPEFSPNGGTFTGSVEVSLASPTPGAVIRYTTDGSAPDATSPLYVSPLVLTDTTTVRARAFRDEMNPSPVSIANFAKAGDFSPKGLPGLALWVRSDAGVAADTGGRVSAWSDQSGVGNHLVQGTVASRPLYVREAQNGLPVLRFDGTNDSLAFSSRLDGTIRALFAVLKQNGTPSWRVILGDVTKDDFYPGSLTLWSSASPAILNGETWLNGVLVNGTTTNRPQTMSVLSVLPTAGVTADRLFDGPRGHDLPWIGDVAELLIYTQPLTSSQRKSIEDYLTLKYAPFVGTAGVPEFSPRGGAFTGSVEFTLMTPTPGAEIRYTTDMSDPDASSPLYTSPVTLTATTTVQARAFRAGMNPSPVSLATFALASDLSPAAAPGLVLWARADFGVASDGSGRVGQWRDLSGRGNDLSQADPALKPSFVPNAQAGQPVLRFDGAGDVLSFKTRLTTMRTIFWVIREDASAPPSYRFLLGDVNLYDFHSGASRELWSGSTSAAITNGETRINGVSVNGLTTNRPTSLSVVSLVTTDNVTADAVSRDRVYGRSWWGDLAELVVYDRALSAAERKSVEDHLALKYALYTPTLAVPRIEPNGSRTLAPVHVTLSAEPGAEVRYTTDGSEPTAASALYGEPFDFATPTTLKARAFRTGFVPSAVATARFLDTVTPAPLFVAGLKLWVKADAGVSGAGASVAAWADQSGSGNHMVQATASNQPQLVPAAANGLPVVRFDGAGDFLSFTTRLTNIRSVFWVIRRSASATPGYRFLLGDPTNYHFCPDATTKLWTASYASPAILNGETRLNGGIVNGTTTDRPVALSLLSVVTTGDVTAATFSKDRTSDYSWWGDLAELLIFDRALPANEREAIEGYLTEKYALFTPKASTPVVEPAGGTLSGPQIVQIGTLTPGATIRYTLDNSEPIEASSAYDGPFEVTGDARVRARAFLSGWTPSAEVVVTFYGPETITPASLPDLALWVRGDAGLASDGSQWASQGNAANSLVQTNATQRPSLAQDPVSRMPLLRFDGAGDYMSFAARLTKIRSVFWVIRRSASMTPGYRLLLGDSTQYNFLSDGTTKLWNASYTSPAVLNGKTRLNGAQVNGLTTDRPAGLSVVSLVTTGDVVASTFSKDRTYDYSWWGDLAELVIYERALSPAEVAAVEAYLAGRYGIGLQQ